MLSSPVSPLSQSPATCWQPPLPASQTFSVGPILAQGSLLSSWHLQDGSGPGRHGGTGMSKADKAHLFASSCESVTCGGNCKEGCRALMAPGTNAKGVGGVSSSLSLAHLRKKTQTQQ